jgi:hypothetical protein
MTYSQNEVLVEGSFDNVRVSIKFILRDENDWVNMKNVSSNLSLIERVVEKHIDEKWFLFNTTLRFMTSFECFEVVFVDDTNVILMILKEKIDIDLELTIFASRLNSNYENMSKIMLKRARLEWYFRASSCTKKLFHWTLRHWRKAIYVVRYNLILYVDRWHSIHIAFFLFRFEKSNTLVYMITSSSIIIEHYLIKLIK